MTLRVWATGFAVLLLGCSKENNVSVNGSDDGVVECAKKPLAPGLIDDFECGLAGKLPPWEERTGGYFTASDDQPDTSFRDVNDPEFDWEQMRCPFAFEGKAAGCAQGKTADCEASSDCWGASYGIGFTVSGEAYDAEARGYTGVRFMMRNVNGGAPQPLRLAISDLNTLSSGGRCTTCDDFFGTELTATGTWREVTLHFAELTQRGFGDAQPALQASTIMTLSWEFGPGQNVQVAYDNIAFISD